MNTEEILRAQEEMNMQILLHTYIATSLQRDPPSYRWEILCTQPLYVTLWIKKSTYHTGPGSGEPGSASYVS